MNDETYFKLLKSYITYLEIKINKAIEFILSFDYYIPEDNKQELLDILKINLDRKI